MNSQQSNTSEPLHSQQVDTDRQSQQVSLQNSSSEVQKTVIRKSKRRRKKLSKRLRIFLIALSIFVAIGTGTALAIYTSIKAGEQAFHSAMQEEMEAVAYSEGKTLTHNGNTYTLNENMISICVIGFDRTSQAQEGENPGQADAIAVFALDTETGEAAVIAIPRDSIVEVGTFLGEDYFGVDEMQICLAYSYGDGGATSCEYTTQAASRVLYNIPISYYIAMNMSGVGVMSDAIGGVALTPLQTIPNTNIVEGQDTVLFGNNALKYVQWRDTSVLNSSLDRQARQVQFASTFATQTFALAQGNIGTLLDLYQTASDYTVTNLGITEYTYLASSLLSNGISSFEMISLTGEMVQGPVYAEYYLDQDAIYETILDVYYTQTN